MLLTAPSEPPRPSPPSLGAGEYPRWKFGDFCRLQPGLSNKSRASARFKPALPELEAEKKSRGTEIFSKKLLPEELGTFPQPSRDALIRLKEIFNILL